MLHIEIDTGSGFCFGVTTAIGKAEEELSAGRPLYCLGDIVHNGMEVKRLAAQGLTTITHEQLAELHDCTVLLRAHGEPPSTYAMADRNHITLIDATCPVVLALQRRIKRQFDKKEGQQHAVPQIVIFGKRGHAEVMGLVGQTGGEARVVESVDEAETLDFSRDIYLYSQTTKSLDEFHRLQAYIQEHIAPNATFQSYDTICRQVANRMPAVEAFAQRHDVVLFVSGKKSSNGKVLFGRCLGVNTRSHHIESPKEIEMSWFDGATTVGICGATSTPKWLMEQCRDYITSHST